MGTGTSRLDLEDTVSATTMPSILASGGDQAYDATTSAAALVVGGGNCANPTPGPFPTPTRVPGTFTPGPSPSVTPLLRNTITFEPSTIPVNQDSVVTLSTMAESPGIANFSITVELGDGVGYVSCSTELPTFCLPPSPTVNFGNLAGKPNIGAFTIGQLTVHPTGPAGKTALSFANIEALYASSNRLTVTIQNCAVTTFAGTPPPSPAPCATPTPAPTATPSSSPTPTPTPTPATLPHTGGASAPRGSTWPAGVALLGGVIVLAAAFVMGRRRLG